MADEVRCSKRAKLKMVLWNIKGPSIKHVRNILTILDPSPLSANVRDPNPPDVRVQSPDCKHTAMLA